MSINSPISDVRCTPCSAVKWNENQPLTRETWTLSRKVVRSWKGCSSSDSPSAHVPRARPLLLQPLRLLRADAGTRKPPVGPRWGL